MSVLNAEEQGAIPADEGEDEDEDEDEGEGEGEGDDDDDNDDDDDDDDDDEWRTGLKAAGIGWPREAKWGATPEAGPW